MITVDVHVPYLSTTYDFNLDETVPIAALIDELTTTICLKERWTPPETIQDLSLFSLAQKRILSRTGSLYSEGIHTGQRLILC